MYQTRKVSGHVDLYYGYQIYLCFYISFIRFWNCSDCLVLFVFHLLVAGYSVKYLCKWWTICHVVFRNQSNQYWQVFII